MRVVDRINEILKEKNISKRELAKRLINLDMRASKTGETPTESSIYAYLNGNIEIKADMLPFIADALGVFEQELFSSDTKQNDKILNRIFSNDELNFKYKNIIELLEYLSPKSLEILKISLEQNRQNVEKLNLIIRQI
ncbi:helix-turn-helix domain-containing protein [Campylobacter mucosalis]|uniref:helix-turn-helix domain-containing protein n=1 Tax=Campylobacter mucosalis TaxID=202 RepID=UPI0014706CE2|nr:helix-turn-helix transcriptional regulator [Campylobacter mucosalis]